VRVLVVDPSDGLRSRVISRLRELGLEVIGEAGTLGETFCLATSLQPDAIVTDIMLPDGRGSEVVAALHRATPSAVLLVLTNTLHYRQQCLASGADYFLDKSVDFDAVAPTLVRARRR